MKVNKKGIMFHHFHDGKFFKKGPGSISGNQLEKMIRYLGRENIINSREFLTTPNHNKKYCFTFDDGLKCQYKIALKVLNRHNIKGFFFVYSSIFTNKPDLLEIYRFFRVKYYINQNSFYNSFFSVVKKLFKNRHEKFLDKNDKLLKNLKKNSPYYSSKDIKFRVTRDYFLNNNQYNDIMLKLFRDKKFNYRNYIKKLHLSKNDIKKLSNAGHEIGLHSHSHPSNFTNLKIEQQIKEFKKNKYILEKIINKKIITASFPFGSYNKKTILALKKNKILYSFQKNLERPIFDKYYELQLPRLNHSNLIKKIK